LKLDHFLISSIHIGIVTDTFHTILLYIRGIQSRHFDCDPVAVSQSFLDRFVSSEMASDVLGPGLGWASVGSGLPILKPDSEPTVRPGLGLVGLEPGLESQNGNTEMAQSNVSPTFLCKIGNGGI
jgi:hypothetical protein